MKNITWKNLYFCALVTIYFSLFLWVLFFNRIPPFYQNSLPAKELGAQLIPLNTSFIFIKKSISNGFSWPTTYMMVSNLLGNVILFIPFGILSPLLFSWVHKSKRILFLTLLFSFAAELIQFYFQIGVFDVDDIILNTLGSVIGYNLLIQFCYGRLEG
ncbi:VanZ family protein [Catalinimonas sp. 4WD22]|uniref:VanZ family protein n=1 Tax=Catalinimonas locisalis TaxID=3133978 RepID=UPI003109BC8A